MKNVLKQIGVGILVLLSMIAIILNQDLTKKEEQEEKNAFQEEYESLNGVINPNNQKTYLSVEIGNNHPFLVASYDQIFEALEGTSILYFGYPECPWCRNLVPILEEAAKKVSIGRIYYKNIKEDRNVLKLENGKIVTEKEGTKEYQKLVEKLSSNLPSYEGLNDASIKRIYVPFVVFVKEGKVIATHTGTLDSQEDPYLPLTEEQKVELKNKLVDWMLEISDSACDSTC